MKFIKRKNLLDGEELLYVPKLHWLFLMKPVFKSIPFFLVFILLLFYSSEVGNLLNLMQLFGYNAMLKEILAYVLYFLIAVTVITLGCRIFQYLNIEFGVTNKRLLIKKGVFRVYVADIPTDRIESIYCIQSFWERIFRCGTLYISGIGGMIPTFFMIYRPFALRRKIVEIVEKNKTINVVHGNLPRAPKPLPKEKEDPIYLFGTFVRVVS